MNTDRFRDLAEAVQIILHRFQLNIELPDGCESREEVVETTEHGIRMCRIKMKAEGVGKINSGQTIFIKLYNYPYMEFGELKTIIPYSFDIQNHTERGYILTIPLSNPLITTKGVPINFPLPMYGQAEIITAENRLVDNLLNPIKSVLLR